MRLFNLTKNRIAVENLTIAESYSERMKGLLGRKNINDREGLLIENCNWIHMFFMKFPIDAVFLRTERILPRKHESTKFRFFSCLRGQKKNTDYADLTRCHSERSEESRDASLLLSMTNCTEKGLYKVVKITENIKPWRLSPPVFRADSVLEIKSETAKNIISIDDELKIMEEK